MRPLHHEVVRGQETIRGRGRIALQAVASLGVVTGDLRHLVGVEVLAQRGSIGAAACGGGVNGRGASGSGPGGRARRGAQACRCVAARGHTALPIFAIFTVFALAHRTEEGAGCARLMRAVAKSAAILSVLSVVVQVVGCQALTTWLAASCSGQSLLATVALQQIQVLLSLKVWIGLLYTYTAIPVLTADGGSDRGVNGQVIHTVARTLEGRGSGRARNSTFQRLFKVPRSDRRKQLSCGLGGTGRLDGLVHRHGGRWGHHLSWGLRS